MDKNWFSNVFQKTDEKGALPNGPDFIKQALEHILKDKQSRFQKTLTDLLKAILDEEQIAKPDDLQNIIG